MLDRGARSPHQLPQPFTDGLAEMAVAALVDEVTLTPKPGLVDLRSRGAHRDLNWLLMCHSAWVLQPTFLAMATAGQSMADMQQLRERIGHVGREGEQAMMQATGGVNTHRGAIWALGLLVTAAAQDPCALSASAVAVRAGALARRPDPHAPAVTGNNGEQACLKYGVGGARSQAQANFPHVLAVGLPMLRRSRWRGDSENAARLNALLAIVAGLDDTCVLSRGGTAALVATQAGATRVLNAGGAGNAQGKDALRQFENELLARHLSPGGAADLLAATLLLDRIERHSSINAKVNDHGKAGV
ncbi:MAG TPA: triphosphoribosyl-dephospho-CoA synthase [Burkholderiaceae bacterium]|nr:triphosphoribosyl-dephospho-CoA synthase [Burkholderiaceae bacterium]